ncbi:MAG: hypothetical protein ABSH36_14340 [Solirubrobacteraceae bacterium]
MDPIITGASSASKILPLAYNEQRKLRRRDEVRNLFSALPVALRSDHRIPAAHKKEVLEVVRGLRVDPTVCGGLKALLDGDSSVLPELEQRASELLRFHDDVDDSAVLEAFIGAVRANVIPAKRDGTAALNLLYREQLASREMLGALGERIDTGTAVAEGSERRIIAEIRTAGGGGGAFALITGEQVFSSQTPSVLKDLGSADRTIAEEVGAELARGGPAALTGWARDQLPRLRERGVDILVHMGRLLMTENEFAAAEQLFVLAAQDDSEDPARQWVRAANAASHAGKEKRAHKHLDQARTSTDASHPALAIAEIQHSNLSPVEMLTRLENVQAATDADRLGLAAARAQAHLIEEDLEKAEEALLEAERVDQTEPQVRELRSIWRLQRAHRATVQGGAVDLEDLNVASGQFLELREELRRQDRHLQSAVMLARAADAHLLAKQLVRASELLDEATEQERTGAARIDLAQRALMCGRAELALELASVGPACERSRLIEASVGVDSPTAEKRASALATLDELLGSGDREVRVEAALTRAVACLAPREPAEWSERAGDILAERDEPLSMIMRSWAHLAHRQFEQAEALLRPLAASPLALAALVDAAALAGDFETALRRSEALLQIRRTPETRLQHAQLLRATGHEVEALEALSEVARSSGPLLPTERESAFHQAVELAQRLQRYDDMERLCSDALTAGAGDEDFHWGRAQARFMRSRHKEALSDLDAAGIEPRTLPQAELLARLLYRAATLPDALRRNVDLSARFGKPERMEALLIMMAPRATGLDSDTQAAIKEVYSTFPQRFPDSKLVILREVPATEEGFHRLLEELAPVAGRDREIIEGIENGTIVTAALAAFHRRTVAELWTLLDPLPTAFGDATLDDLERQDARKALAAPAVLDPTCLSILAGLGGQIEQAVLTALPGSVIAQATLEDADRAAGPLGDPVGPAASMARDPRTGELRVVPIDEAQVERQAEHQHDHLRIARTLRIEPNTDPEPRDEIEKALAGQDGGIDGALSTWAATLAVAARTGLPVLSDDRRARISARQSGIPNFSTEALLRVLVQAGDVNEAVLADARERLLRRGALGLHPSSEELVALGRGTAFEPSTASKLPDTVLPPTVTPVPFDASTVKPVPVTVSPVPETSEITSPVDAMIARFEPDTVTFELAPSLTVSPVPDST